MVDTKKNAKLTSTKTTKDVEVENLFNLLINYLKMLMKLSSLTKVASSMEGSVFLELAAGMIMVAAASG